MICIKGVFITRNFTHKTYSSTVHIRTFDILLISLEKAFFALNYLHFYKTHILKHLYQDISFIIPSVFIASSFVAVISLFEFKKSFSNVSISLFILSA